jgi:hypothetical protein
VKPYLQKGGIPLFGKEGRGRFSQQYVFSIMDSFLIPVLYLFYSQWKKVTDIQIFA